MWAEIRNSRRRGPAPAPVRDAETGLRWAARLMLGVAAFLLTDLALQPGFSHPATLFGRDKLEHIAAFAALTVVARLGWPGAPRLVLALPLLAYGAALEWLQGSQALGRTASMSDVIADVIGVGVGFWALWVAAQFAPFFRFRRA